MLDSKKIVNGYLYQSNWRVKENSNSPYCYGGLGKHIMGEVSKDYWLRHIYKKQWIKFSEKNCSTSKWLFNNLFVKNSKVAQAYLDGEIHIHDLNALTVYCCGYSLRKVIEMGVKGVPNIPESAPAKHFSSILNQLSNIITVFQNEIAGAVAFSSIDTLLAPFIKEDNLSYEEIKQQLQNFIFSINSNSRGGAEPAFSNITLDLFPPSDLINQNVLFNGRELNYTYKECQNEMNMFNKAFYELMTQGDSKGRLFSYPIPTYNIHDKFDWDNPNNQGLWEMTGKFGVPYFANFINSDMNPEDARSMCCRLRLDKRELRKRAGGFFGAGESTGSIGVVTLNLPHLAYNAKNKNELFRAIERVMIIAKDSLEIKRKFLTDIITKRNLLPAFNTYVGTLNNHFSTIGLIGLNEMCENLLGKNIDITTEEGKKLSLEVLDFMRIKLADFQEETGNLYNLEATPAESTAFRLARKDLKIYPDIIVRGTKQNPYYTNSCHMPVNKVTSIKQLFDNQEDFQVKFTGGTVIHIFLKRGISAEKAKHIIKTVCEYYKVPYVSISPLTCYCDNCGYVETDTDNCPVCNAIVDKEQRITGYTRKVKYFNDGKAQEFKERNQITVTFNDYGVTAKDNIDSNKFTRMNSGGIFVTEDEGLSYKVGLSSKGIIK